MTREEILDWVVKARYAQATHIIIVRDTYRSINEDYPVMVFPPLTADEVFKRYDCVNMQKVMAVLNMELDIENQIDEILSDLTFFKNRV